MDFYYNEDRICECCLFNNYSISQDEIYYVCNNSNLFKFQIDFYNYMENFLSNNSSVFDDELLSINLIRSQSITFNEKRLTKLLELIKDSILDFKLKINLVKYLICWHSQFNNLNLIEKIIKFNQEYLKTDEKFLGNFHNTLLFSIHSHSLEIVKFMIENLGTNLDMSAFKYAIIENQPEILHYLIGKTDSSCLKLELLEFLIEISIKESKIDCLEILLKNSINFKNEINKNKLMTVCQYLSLSLNSNALKKDLKYDLFKMIFEIFQIDLASEITPSSETIFSACFEFTEPKFYNLFFKHLKVNKKINVTLDEIITSTLINKMKRSFECNLRLVEILLNNINNKKLLYKKLIQYDNSRLLRPCENHFKNFKLDPPPESGYNSKIKNSYFIKHQMLVKYDIIPIDKRGIWLSNYVYYWAQNFSSRPAYASASSILRYISSDEMIDLVSNYLNFLIDNGFMNMWTQCHLSWWYDLINKRKMNNLNSNIKDRIESIIFDLYNLNKKTPCSLKMIARNKIRYLLVSLSNESINSLKLPIMLVKYIRSD